MASDGVLDRNFTLLGPGDTEVGSGLKPGCMVALLRCHAAPSALALYRTACSMGLPAFRARFANAAAKPPALSAAASSSLPPICLCPPSPPLSVQAGEVLLKDSMHCFKFWASGRRFCQARMHACMPQHGGAPLPRPLPQPP